MSDDQWYVKLAEQGSIPLGRAGLPDKAVSTIALLLSDRAGFTSGTAIDIVGGQAAVW